MSCFQWVALHMWSLLQVGRNPTSTGLDKHFVVLSCWWWYVAVTCLFTLWCFLILIMFVLLVKMGVVMLTYVIIAVSHMYIHTYVQ